MDPELFDELFKLPYFFGAIGAVGFGIYSL